MEFTKNTFFEYPDYFMFTLFVATSFLLVSIGDVFTNSIGILRSDYSSFFGFFVTAVRNTSIVIQLLIIGFLIRVAVSSTRMAYKNMGSFWPFANKFFGSKY